MNFPEFCIAFLLMIIFACAMIMGFYIVTRGEWYINPDNTWKTEGMIFKWWSLFWEQASIKTPERKIVYSGQQLSDKFIFLKKVRPDVCERYRIFGNDRLIKKDGTYASTEDVAAISDALACEISHGATLQLYYNEFVYRYPSWIRKPISQCPPCMSSIYGSGYYWFSISESATVFRWASFPLLAKLGFWVIFCLILACANKFIDQKMKL